MFVSVGLRGAIHALQLPHCSQFTSRLEDLLRSGEVHVG